MLVFLFGLFVACIVAEPNDSCFIRAVKAQPPSSEVRRQPHHALLIGISDYAHPNARYHVYPNLDSESDIKAIKAALLTSVFGFKDNAEEFTVLTTKEQTTNASIEAAFKKLIRDTGKDDIVYIHYSGHGSELPARAGSSSLTGMNQTIVPSDWNADYTFADITANAEISHEIRDVDLDHWLMLLKEKQPKSVTISFDCCHSGLLTQGVRGVSTPIRGRDFSVYPVPGVSLSNVAAVSVPAGLDGATGSPVGSPVGVARGQVSGNAGGDALTMVPAGQANSWGFVSFSACQFDQVDHEIYDEQNHLVGPLSYYLAKAYTSAGPETTAQDIWEKVNSQVTAVIPDQNPQVGGRINAKLGQNVETERAPYVVVKVKNAAYELQAGSLQGVTEKSLYNLYEAKPVAAGATPEKQADAEVGPSIDLTSAVLKVTKWYVKSNPSAVVLYATEARHYFGDSRVRVDISSIERDPDAKSVVDALKSLAKNRADGGLVKIGVERGEQPQYALARTGGKELVVTGTALRGVAPPRAGSETDRPGFAVVHAVDGAVVSVIQDSGPLSAADPSNTPDSVALQIEAVLKSQAKADFVRNLENDAANASVNIEIKMVPCVAHANGRRIVFDRELPEAPACKTVVLQAGTAKNLASAFLIKVRNLGPKAAYYSVLDVDSAGTVSVLWPRRKTQSTEDSNQGRQFNLLAPAKYVRRTNPGSDGWVTLQGTDETPLAFPVVLPLGSETIKLIASETDVDFTMLDSRNGGKRGPVDRTRTTPLGLLLSDIDAGQRGVDPVAPDVWSTKSVTYRVQMPTAPPGQSPSESKP